MADQPAVGLISCGSMGMSLARALVAGGAGRLVAVADVEAEKRDAAAAEFGVPGYASHDELLAHAGLDAVVIAAPPFLHAPLALDAIAAGKHLFVEKPFAVTVEACDAMIAAARAAGVRLMVGQVLRYYPTWRHIREMVAAGEVGQLLGVQVTRVGGGWGAWERSWRAELAKCGGLLMEINAHEIDFMCVLGGEVERVYAAMGPERNPGCDYPNLAFVSLHFRSGAVGVLHSSQASALGDLSGKIEGTEGSIFYQNGFSRDGVIRHARRGGQTTTLSVGDLETVPGVQAELQEFVTAIVEQREPAVPGSEGRRPVAVALAAYRSAQTGQAEPVP